MAGGTRALRKAGRAQKILDDLAEALTRDELLDPLVQRLEKLTGEAAQLIEKRPSTWTAWHRAQRTVEGRKGYAEALAALAAELQQKVEAEDPGADVRLVVQAVLERRREDA